VTVLFPLLAVVVLVLALAAGVVWLIAQTPVRIAAVAAAVMTAATHPAVAVTVVPVLAALLTGLAAWIVWRALAPCGWRLIVTSPPRPAPTSS